MFKKQEWELVLLDLMMPGKSGEEVLAEIVDQWAVNVLIISAKGNQQARIEELINLELSISSVGNKFYFSANDK